MVRLLLTRERKILMRKTWRTAWIILVLGTFALAADKSKTPTAEPGPPDIRMDGGRRLVYERTFYSAHDVETKRGFWKRVIDVIAGPPEYRGMVRPYDIAVDSHGRLIITDPGAYGIHIFDFEQKKYKFLERKDAGKDPMRAPQGVAVDARDNIYVTDSESGKIFVFAAGGRFRRALGSLKGGEGYFKRPTGVAVDSEAQRIYITDTLRNEVFVLDMDGSVMEKIGHSGTAEGEFNYPTELLLNGKNLAVVDAMNFRVQVMDRSGEFGYAVGKIGDNAGGLYRPKGIGFDSEGHLYVVDGLSSLVQVFNNQGQLLYYFGGRGTSLGFFQLPTGLAIDRTDQIFVVDSFNRRVQVFRYFAIGQWGHGGVH
jgi:DNA-binding beta-propeller fold protein YncE